MREEKEDEEEKPRQVEGSSEDGGGGKEEKGIIYFIIKFDYFYISYCKSYTFSKQMYFFHGRGVDLP